MTQIIMNCLLLYAAIVCNYLRYTIFRDTRIYVIKKRLHNL